MWVDHIRFLEFPQDHQHLHTKLLSLALAVFSTPKRTLIKYFTNITYFT
jgi:hypothetical protein